MYEKVLEKATGADIVIGAAAVGDFAPEKAAVGKTRRKSEHTLRLVPTKDCIGAVGKLGKKRPKVVVGFATEATNLIEKAKAKLSDKGIDLVVANDITQPEGCFGSDFNQASLVFADGTVNSLARLSKEMLAEEILQAVKMLLEQR
jgi:phosphopantothenoylcysteine decarboxylase/phosphopantothenate--cysteine ligase